MKAQWLVTTTEAGVSVTYLNLLDGSVHNCGVANGPPILGLGMLSDIIEFAVNEGACNGDGLYVNGSLLMLIKLNGDYCGKGAYCN